MEPKAELRMRKLPGRIADSFPNRGDRLLVALCAGVIAAVAYSACFAGAVEVLVGWERINLASGLLALMVEEFLFLILFIVFFVSAEEWRKSNRLRIEELERALEDGGKR